MENQDNKFVPNISVEVFVNNEKVSLVWDRERISRLVYICLNEMKLMKLENNRPVCAIPTKDIEKIVDTICEQIFNPRSIEEIITNLAKHLIKVAMDVRIKNPEIIIVK